MSAFKRLSHHRGFSLASTLLFMVDQCLSSPLLVLPRNQGTTVLSVDSATPAQPVKSASTHIIPGWKNSSAIIFFVAIVSLAITVPMFVYIWIRRRRLHAARVQSRNQGESKIKLAHGARKGSVASTVNMPLTAAAPIAGREGRGTGMNGMKTGTGGAVNFAEPVQISVKSTKAVEIMVKPMKPAKTAENLWEKV